MDEPTSVLTPQEVEQLFETLRKLAAQGCSILYISHKLHEIIALCETATILRGGKFVAECDPREETSKSMAELMIGAQPEGDRARRGARVRAGEIRGAQPEPAQARRFRHGAQGHFLLRARGRDPRRRGRRRQRAERADGGAERRSRRARRIDRAGGQADRPARADGSGARSASAPCRRSATATPPSPISRSRSTAR